MSPRPADGGCADCAWNYGRPQANFAHVHKVAELPRETDDILHGYAVGLRGRHLPATWFFFETLDTALVFGRSGRRSMNVGSYGVRAAARELRFAHSTGTVISLYVEKGYEASLDNKPGEHDALRRWVEATIRQR